MLTDADGRLRGLFTDSDLARLFEQRRDAMLDRPIREVMTADPITVPQGDARHRRGRGAAPPQDQRIAGRGCPRPAGRLLDITDLIGLMPVEAAEEAQVA